MGRVKQPIPMAEAKLRVLGFMQPRRIYKASQFAEIIWPNERFLTGQGAGAAASRVLTSLIKDDKIRWVRTESDWGYCLGGSD